MLGSLGKNGQRTGFWVCGLRHVASRPILPGHTAALYRGGGLTGRGVLLESWTGDQLKSSLILIILLQLAQACCEALQRPSPLYLPGFISSRLDVVNHGLFDLAVQWESHKKHCDKTGQSATRNAWSPWRLYHSCYFCTAWSVWEGGSCGTSRLPYAEEIIEICFCKNC